MANHVKRRERTRAERAERKGSEFAASHRWARMSPRKVRLVADQVRGLSINSALEQLQFSNRRAARMIEKVVRSALANAEFQVSDNRLDVDLDQLVLDYVAVDDGPTLKRWMTRARGTAYPILKRSCHIAVCLRPRAQQPTAS